MAHCFNFLPTREFQNYSGFALNPEIAELFDSFVMIPIGISKLAVFAGVMIVKLYQGRVALERAMQMHASSQYIAYAFQCLAQGDPKDMLMQVMQNFGAQISRELDVMVEFGISRMSDARKALFLTTTSASMQWSLQLSCLASLFEVTLLTLTMQTRSFSLPLFPTATRILPTVPLMSWGNVTVVFAGGCGELQVPHALVDMLHCAELTEGLIAQAALTDAQCATVRRFLARYVEMETMCEQFDAKLDEVARTCLNQAINLKRLLICSTCGGRAETRLRCNHWACLSCTFPDEEWDVMNPVVSPCCSQELQMSEIRDVLTDEKFLKKVLALHEYLYGLCIKCGKLTENGQWCELECRHDVCYSCLISAVHTRSALCDICQTYPNEAHIKYIDESQIPCSLCERKKKLINFPKFRCKDHFVCFECFDISTVCPVCSRELTTEELSTITHCFFTCQACNEFKNRKHLLSGGVCGCRICSQCFEENMKKTMKITSCFQCKARYPEQTVDRHYRRFKEIIEDVVIEALPMIIDQRHIKRSPCEICHELDSSEKISLPCKHILHSFCLVHRLADQRIKGESAACPICKQAMDLKFVKNAGRALFPEEKKCPKCKEDLKEADENSYKCDAENVTYCKKCLTERKENHTPEVCSASRRSFVCDTLRKYSVKDPTCSCRTDTCTLCHHLAQCPTCKTPHLKLPGRKDTVCTVCQTKFCHGCSAALEPIQHHGDMWHRPQCPYSTRKSTPNAQEVIEKTAKAEECAACKKANGRCEAPSDLQVRGEFP